MKFNNNSQETEEIETKRKRKRKTEKKKEEQIETMDEQKMAGKPLSNECSNAPLNDHHPKTKR